MNILPRSVWGARPPSSVRVIPVMPTEELWLHHTAGSHSGPHGVKSIQDFHMDGRGWSDIAYSFLIDRDTLDVYEGRGAGIAGAHTKGHNSVSHAICVMGNFHTTHTPTEALQDRIAELVQHGHGQGWWPDQLSGGHRDTVEASTSCPGDALWTLIPNINLKAGTMTTEQQSFLEDFADAMLAANARGTSLTYVLAEYRARAEALGVAGNQPAQVAVGTLTTVTTDDDAIAMVEALKEHLRAV